MEAYQLLLGRVTNKIIQHSVDRQETTGQDRVGEREWTRRD